MSEVFVVSSYDLGGNSGYVVEAVFTTREKAETWAASATEKWQKKWPQDEEPYWVETSTLPLDPDD